MPDFLSVPSNIKTMLNLKEKYKSMLLEIIRECFLMPVEVWAYGSRIDGTAHDGSDLDLIIRAKDLSAVDLETIDQFREKTTGKQHTHYY